MKLKLLSHNLEEVQESTGTKINCCENKVSKIDHDVIQWDSSGHVSLLQSV